MVISNDMAKKNFSGGIDSLFKSPNHEFKKEKNPNEDKDLIEFTRTTLILNIGTYEKIKALAYWKRKSIKDVIENSFNQTLMKYSIDELKEMVEFYRKNGT